VGLEQAAGKNAEITGLLGDTASRRNTRRFERRKKPTSSGRKAGQSRITQKKTHADERIKGKKRASPSYRISAKSLGAKPTKPEEVGGGGGGSPARKEAQFSVQKEGGPSKHEKKKKKKKNNKGL